MKHPSLPILFAAFTTYAYANPLHETTEWEPERDLKFVTADTKVLTKIKPKQACVTSSNKQLFTIKPGSLKVLVNLSKDPKPKAEWKITERIYTLFSAGAPFGTAGIISSGPRMSNEFTIVYTRGINDSHNGKSGTLYSQIQISGKNEQTGATATDTGISGKDTDPTVTLKF